MKEKNEEEVTEKMKKIRIVGIIWSLVFFISLFLSIFEKVNICGMVDSTIITIIIMLISFVLSTRAIVLLVITKEKKSILKSGVSDIILLLLFSVAFVLIIASSPQGNRSKAIEVSLKATFSSLQPELIIFYDENNRFPKDFEELRVGENSFINSYVNYDDIILKDTGDPKTWYVEANIYEKEKRFPCEDVIKVKKTIGYYCTIKGINQECYFENY